MLGDGAKERGFVQQAQVEHRRGEGRTAGLAPRRCFTERRGIEQPVLGKKIVNGLVVSLEHEEVRPGPRSEGWGLNFAQFEAHADEFVAHGDRLL
jgi:hypothetical protein